jgi:hypothetical protein
MTYAVVTFPRPRTLKLLELTDNRYSAEWTHTFAPRPAAVVRLGERPAVLIVSGGIKIADLIGDAKFWAAVNSAIQAHRRQQEQQPDLDKPHRKRRPWH